MQREDKRQYHYIYKITRDDGRYYIGMHSTDDLEDGYFGSGKLITRSIKKHGLGRHSKEILEFLPSRDTLRDREKELITEEMRDDPLCMNIAPGGQPAGFFSDEHRRKFLTDGAKLGGRIAGHLHGHINAKRMHTPEARAKALDTKRANGLYENCGIFLSKFTHTLAANTKRNATFARRGHQQSEKKSQFGTCWINDGINSTKIKKDQLDEFLSAGYLIGKVINITHSNTCQYCGNRFASKTGKHYCCEQCKKYGTSPAKKIVDDNLEYLIEEFSKNGSISKTLKLVNLENKLGNRYFSNILKECGFSVLRRRNTLFAELLNLKE